MLSAVCNSQFMELFGDPKTNQKGLPILKIGEFGKVKGGKRLPKGESYADHTTNHPYVRVIDMVKHSVTIPALVYLTQATHEKISRYAQRFPFDQFKHHKGSNVTWSLEHIHAQQSEGMKTQDVWKKWLELHIPSVESIGGEHSELIDEMQGAINADKLERTVFESIQQKVLGLLSVSGNTEYMHSIANLALLNTADNAALNNSTFDVKRNDIIQMDKKGQYIPFCTKMVFLKYYTPSAENQLHFWGQADRIAYIKAINDVLSDYIEPIVLEKEETK